MITEATGTVRVVETGGSGLRRCDVDARGNILNFQFLPKDRFKHPKQIINFAKENIPSDSTGVAYAAAAVIKDKSTIINAPNFVLMNGQELASETTIAIGGLPSYVFNDMEAAAAGIVGLMPDLEDAWIVTWGGGIGLRAIGNRRILGVSEAGHTVIDPSPFARLCGCGRRGCAEAYAGGGALARRVTEELAILGLAFPSSDPNVFFTESLASRVDWAVEIGSIAATAMGLALANVQTILPRPAFVFKGSVARNLLPHLEADIRQVMLQRLMDRTWATVPFYESPKPDEDALIGAACLFREELPISL